MAGFEVVLGGGQPVTGRVFVLFSRVLDPEPRLQRVGWGSVHPFFGIDVDDLQPKESVRFDAVTPGFPVDSLADVPAGEYSVQALCDVYTWYERGDGTSLWAPGVGWEGRVFTKGPGNLFSNPQTITWDPEAAESITLVLDQEIPPVEFPEDTHWVKRFQIRSEALSEFWGREMQVGATVLLPPGYEDNPDKRYPVVYVQNHFSFEPPFSFPELATEEEQRFRDQMSNETQIEAQSYHEALGFTESPDHFQRLWVDGELPEFIAVTFQHPNPWFDSSHAVNSANAGPFEDAIIDELLPEFERRFRTIQQPWARLLTGGSTGGWTALNLQVKHPTTFGGVWCLFPSPVDFRSTILSNVYEDESMFVVQDHEERDRDHRFPSQEWGPAERPFRRTIEGQVHVTMRQMDQLERTVGSKSRSGLQIQPWHAILGPVGDDGYPRPLWDENGTIDHEVANYMRDQGFDLSHYIRTNWETLAPDLIGKLFFFCGEMDNYYLNVPLYLLEEFLEEAKPHYQGSFTYGRPKQGHYWVPWTHQELLTQMAEHITNNALATTDSP
jgi:enterochelin esterase-like enzyme